MAARTSKVYSIFGFEIERKTDFLAAAAFLLALASTLYQFYGFARGAIFSVYPPDRIHLYYDIASDGQAIIRFGSDLTFVNGGQVGQDLIVKSVDATINLDRRAISRQRWLNVVRLERQGGRAVLVPLGSAHPIQVSGGSATTNSYSFSPRSEDCGTMSDCGKNFVTVKSFTDAFQMAKKLSVSFEAKRFGTDRAVEVSCETRVTDAQRLSLALDNWVSIPCHDLS